MNGSERYTGSLTIETTVMVSPWRMKCSVIVARSLVAAPLR